MFFPKIIGLFEDDIWSREWAELLAACLVEYFGLAVAFGSGETEQT